MKKRFNYWINWKLSAARCLLDLGVDLWGDLTNPTLRKNRGTHELAAPRAESCVGFALPTEAQGELHDAWIGGGCGDGAKCGGTEAAVGLSKGGRVGDVEDLGTELKIRFPR